MRVAFLCIALVAADFFHDVVVPSTPKQQNDNGYCSLCVNLSGQALNQLLNIILNAGVAGGCAKVCGGLDTKIEKDACDIVCLVVGVKAFAAAVEKADLDPIYFCELTHSCAAGPDDANVKLVAAHASPATVEKGTEFQLMIDLEVTKATGIGEFAIYISGPNISEPISETFLLEQGIPLGNQTLGAKVTLKDKSQAQPPLIFQPGTYNFNFEICQGVCGSKHPHSKDFGKLGSTFKLTPNPNPPAPSPSPSPSPSDLILVI